MPNQPIQLHPENGCYLLFRGRPTILIGAGEHYGAVINADFDYGRYLDELQACGLNQTRTFSGTYRELPTSFSITDNVLAPERFLCPWGPCADADGQHRDKFDLNVWNPAYFVRLKDFIAAAGRRGIVVEYVLFCTNYNEALWNASPMHPANNINSLGNIPAAEAYTLRHSRLLAFHEAFVRKVVLELQPFDNVYLEICNEPYWGQVADDWQTRITDVIVAAREGLPAHHLIAQNIANGSKRIEKPHPAVSIFNFHYAQPPDAVALNASLHKVIADDETGFAGRDDVTYRREAWEFILAGGGIFSHLDYSFTTRHPAGDLVDHGSPGGGSPKLRRELKILRDFIESFDFIHMQPANEIVRGGVLTAYFAGVPARAGATVRVLAGKSYAIYISGGEAVQLNLELAAGSYTVEWINTCTGRIDKSERFDHPGGCRELSSPAYTQDIALAIRR